MEDRIKRLIVALGKFEMKQYRNNSFMPGLNSSETGIFWAMTQILAENPDVKLFSLSDLNSYLNYTRPNLSQTINKLEDKNYVERVALKDDRRVTYIRLVEDGKVMLTEKFSEITKRMKKIESILGEDDTEKLIELVIRFAEAYDETE